MIDITPYSSIEYSDNNITDENLSNAYTRLIIYQIRRINAPKLEPCSIRGDHCLPYQERSWLSKLLTSKTYSFNFSANITVGSNFVATVPLATIEHITDDNGEKFSRVMYHREQSFPLFLIRSDATNNIVTANFAVKAEDKKSGNISDGLGLIQGVVKFVAPQSAVLTPLSQQSTKDVATALDKSINQLFSKNLSEGHWVGNDIRRWGEGAKVTFKVPVKDNEDWINKKAQPIGTWVVKFEDPYPSIFSDIQVCKLNGNKKCEPTFEKAAYAATKDAKTRPSDVLNFQLINISNGSNKLGSLISYLKQQDWWDTSVQQMTQDATKAFDEYNKIAEESRKAEAELQKREKNLRDVTESYWKIYDEKIKPSSSSKKDRESIIKNDKELTRLEEERKKAKKDLSDQVESSRQLEDKFIKARKSIDDLRNNTNETGHADTIQNFCRSVKLALSNINLNYVDQNIALQAIVDGFVFAQNTSERVKQGCIESEKNIRGSGAVK